MVIDVFLIKINATIVLNDNWFQQSTCINFLDENQFVFHYDVLPIAQRMYMERRHALSYAGADLGFCVGGTKFGKVIWEYYYYCLRCLWNVWCRKIKIDLQVIMIIWGEETEPLFPLSVFFLLCLFGFFCFLGGRTSLPPPSESASGYAQMYIKTIIIV